MRLFIAEKPSMGMEIAKVLANKNNKLLERSDGFISVGNDVVTWQFGHILELKSASELDPQYEKRYQRSKKHRRLIKRIHT